MSDANSRKIYVSCDDTAVISCPHCDHQKTVPVGSYKGKTRVKIKCGCKNVLDVNLEFRRNVRKKTNLSGKFTNHSQKKHSWRYYYKKSFNEWVEFCLHGYR